VATHLIRDVFKAFYVESQISPPEFKATKMIDFKALYRLKWVARKPRQESENSLERKWLFISFP